MDESLVEEVVPQAAPKSWRRFGMVAAALGTAGAIFGVTRPKSLTTLQKMQRVAHVGRSFMQAVVTRALQDDDEGISIDMGMVFAAADLEKFEGVSAAVYLRPAEDEDANNEHITVTFQAKEDQGKALADEFQKILDGVKEHFKDAEDAPPVWDMFEVSQDEDDSDKVLVTFTNPDEPDFGEETDNLEEGMAAKPTLTLMVHTGRDFQEMVDNIHGCGATLHGGINITASTKLAMALLHAMNHVEEEELGGMGYNPYETEQRVQETKTFEAFSSVSSHSDIRYDTAKLEDAVCDAEESDEKKEQVEQVKAMLPHMLVGEVGEDTVRAAAGLSEYADHLISIQIGGFPHNYEIQMYFENFQLTPVISEFLQLPDEE